MSEQQLLDRIRKLLRLARGTTHRAEAEAALLKAAELADGAGLAIDGIDADRQEIRITHERGGVRRRSHSRLRCHGVLRRHFSVEVLGSSGTGCIYIGPAVNIAIAQHVEAYLLRQCADGWLVAAAAQQWGPTKAAARKKKAARQAYEVGFYFGINKVLADRPVRNDAQEIKTAVERYMGTNFKVSRKTMAAPSKQHAGAIYAGMLRGAATRVDRPVDGSDAPQALPARARLIGGEA